MPWLAQGPDVTFDEIQRRCGFDKRSIGSGTQTSDTIWRHSLGPDSPRDIGDIIGSRTSNRVANWRDSRFGEER